MTKPILSKKSDATYRRLYRALNAEQRRAVDTIEGVVLVLAGPGTGKTQVVAMRIANILRQTQLKPDNILCLTFTESGVTAMRTRLMEIVGPAAYYVRIHTFHSFCNDIIQEHPEKFSFARDLTLVSEVERVALGRAIIDALPAASPLRPSGNPYLYVTESLTNIRRLKQEHVTPAQFQQLVRQNEKFALMLGTALRRLPKQPRATDLRRFYTHVREQRKAFPAFSAYFAHLTLLHKEFVTRRTAASGKKATVRAAMLYLNDLRRWQSTIAQRLPKQRAFAKVFSLYASRLRRQGQYDFEDMLTFVVDRFKRDPAFLAQYQEQFQYLLIDEYQDTNGIQNEAITLLGAFHENPNIFVVGDDKQSIFRFQGASLENVLYFYQRYRATAQVIVLQKNYRSPQILLNAARAVIGHNQETIERYIPAATQRLRAARTGGNQPIVVAACANTEAEDRYLMERVSHLLKKGVPAEDIAILCRRNAEVAAVGEYLQLRGVPVYMVHEGSLFATPEILQLYMLLQYLVRPEQAAQLFSLLSFPWLGLPALDLVKLQRYSVRTKVDLFAALTNRAHLKKAEVEGRAIDILLEAGRQLAMWQTAAATVTAPLFLASIFQETTIARPSGSGTAPVALLSRLTALFREAEAVHRQRGQVSVADFVEYLRLLDEHHLSLPLERTAQPGAVAVMTAHKAKGLEFPHVLIARAVDKNWGNVRSRTLLPLPPGILTFDPVWEQAHNEDERRLFYVAMTRAKRTLTVTYAAHSASGRAQAPSIFLAELPARTVEEQRSAALPANVRSVVPSPPPVSDKNLKVYLRMLLDRSALSVTQVNAYLECPRLFYYRHLLRVPYVPSMPLALGTAVHAALHDFYARVTPHKVPSKRVLLQSFAQRLNQAILTPVDMRDTQKRGRALLAAYYDHYRATFRHRALVEYSFAHHGVSIQNIPLTGRIDKIEIVDPARAHVNVVDYKTGNPDNARGKIKAGGDYHRQLVFYQLLCDRSPRFPYTMVSGEIDFLQPSRQRGTYVKKKIVVTPDDTTNLVTTLREVWHDMQSLAFLDPRNAALCGKCEFCKMSARGSSSQEHLPATGILA